VSVLLHPGMIKLVIFAVFVLVVGGRVLGALVLDIRDNRRKKKAAQQEQPDAAPGWENWELK
jgi:hypothetical protein